MGSQTLTSFVTTGITLTPGGAYFSPFTITPTGGIQTQGVAGVYANTQAYITNAGTISAATYGVDIQFAPATVLNSGTILNSSTLNGHISPAKYLTAIYLGDGGTVINSGTAALIAGDAGIVFNNAPGTIINSGTITANASNPGTRFGDNYIGVVFGAGGSIYNSGLISDGTLQSVFQAYEPGIDVASNTTLLISGAGTISGRTGGGKGDGNVGIQLGTNTVLINGGPAVAGNTIIGGQLGGAGVNGDANSTFTNYGTVIGGQADDGLGGQEDGGLNSGVAVYTAGSVFNHGSILGGPTSDADETDAGRGINIQMGGYLYNSGTVSGGTGTGAGNGAYGLYSYGPSTIINQESALIIGGAGGEADIHNDSLHHFLGGIGAWIGGSAVLLNAGTIEGGAGNENLNPNQTFITSSGIEIFKMGGGTGSSGLYIYNDPATNAGLVIGGNAGNGVGYGGYGGVGAMLSGDYGLNNTGQVIGGVGGHGIGPDSREGISGAGVRLIGLYDSTLTNSGTVSGGAGTIGTYFRTYDDGAGGTGGAGVFASTAHHIITNTALITGGAGGNGGLAGGTYNLPGLGGPGGEGIFSTGFLTVTNSGTIAAGSGGDTGGESTPSGTAGIGIITAYGDTIINTGTILGGASGVFGAGPNGGGIGVALNGATLINAGTIIGGGEGTADAVAFGTAASTLILQPGARFSGAIAANPGHGDILELQGASGLAVTGLTGFDTISFAPGASWNLAGSFANAGMINGFAFGDSLDLQNFAATTETFSNNALTLSGADTETLAIFGNFTSADFLIQSDNNGGTVVDVTCFCSGTRILTPTGEVPVENLRPGDLVITASAQIRPVIWAGREQINIQNHPEPKLVRPIRITAGALGLGLPERDLRLSPHHAVQIDGTLVEAQALVNGTTIFQEENLSAVTYHHLELPSHDILLAEGTPCESYRDTGLRLKAA